MIDVPEFDSQVVAEPEISEGEEGSEKRKGKGKYRPTFDDEEEDSVDSSSDSTYSNESINSIAREYLQPGDGELMRKALEIIINEKKASTSYLQRRLVIGYNRAAELMDQLEKRGIISAPLPGGQKRDILILDKLIETNNNL